MGTQAERLGHRPGRVRATDRAWPVPGSVREAVMRTEALLRDHGVPADAAGLAALVLAEALNNVAEHAFAEAPADWIRVDLALDGVRLDVTIADCGAAMPGLEAPAGAEVNLAVPREALPEGGFGWFLIRQLTSGLRYNREGGTNLLCLTFDLAALGRADLPR